MHAEIMPSERILTARTGEFPVINAEISVLIILEAKMLPFLLNLKSKIMTMLQGLIFHIDYDLADSFYTSSIE